MTNRSQVDGLAPINMIDPQAFIINNTTVAGAACDLQGVDAATIIAQVGAWGDTVSGGQIEFAVQHSDDTVAGNFVDVPNAQLTDVITLDSTVTGATATGGFGQFSSTSNDQTTFKTGYIGRKRYIRVKINGEKNLAIGNPGAVLLLKGKNSYEPV